MENKDILDYQLDVFHKTLEKYKLRKGQKIVFIHGKGDGVLRQRILWELQTKYKRFRHQDASFKSIRLRSNDGHYQIEEYGTDYRNQCPG